MSSITTHILDTALGKPATGVPVILEALVSPGEWKELAESTSDSDGRIRRLLPDDFPIKSGKYRLTFKLDSYFHNLGRPTFYPEASITFEIKDASQKYHIPLLISGFGYSTYRGT